MIASQIPKCLSGSRLCTQPPLHILLQLAGLSLASAARTARELRWVYLLKAHVMVLQTPWKRKALATPTVTLEVASQTITRLQIILPSLYRIGTMQQKELVNFH